MKLFKKACVLASAFFLSLSLASCSWEEITVTPEGTPIVNPSGGGTTTTIKSEGTYGLTYSYGLDFCIVTGYFGTESDVFIPVKQNDKPVIGISANAFYNNNIVESITITSTVDIVQENALIGNYTVYCETDKAVECDNGCGKIHPPKWSCNWYVNTAENEDEARTVNWNCGSFGYFSWECNADDDIVITGYIGDPKKLTIPEKIGRRTVVAIKSDAFKDCTSLEEINLPPTLESIGSFAFQRCTSLKSITIPEKVTYISSYMFDACKSLSSILLSNTTSYIGDGAFANCEALTEIEIPASVTKIGNFAFHGSKNITVYLDSGSNYSPDWFCDCIDKDQIIRK